MGKFSNTFTVAKEYLIISLGLLLYVVGWTVFLVPNNLIGGGVTGIASIVQYATKGFIKIGTTYFVVNIGLLIAAVFTLGKSFGGKTVYAVVFTSIALNIMQGVIPDEICQTLAVDNGKLLSTIMGGIFVGIGIGMAMSQGGSTGGTDIIALIVNKYRNVSPGRMILMLDVIIITSSLLVPSFTATGELMVWTEKLTTVIYGFVLVFVTSTVLDYYLSGSKQSVQVLVFSKKFQEIADTITLDLHRGVTVLNGEGWYSKQDMKVVLVMTRKTDLNILLRYIKMIDPDAFVSVSLVSGVYGKGFETIKLSRQKKIK